MLSTIRNTLRVSPILLSLCVGSLSLTGCGTGASADETRQPATESSPSLIGRIGEALFGKTYEVSSGTAIHARLDHAVSTAANAAGDRFTASLDEDLTSEGKLLAPKGSQLSGILTEVEGSKRVKGRALLRMELTSLSINGEEHSIETSPLMFQAQATKKKDALVIGGGSALGAVIGAIAGGGKGAAIGSGVGAGAGTGLVLATKGKEVKLGAETPLTFVLRDSIDLPEYDERGS